MDLIPLEPDQTKAYGEELSRNMRFTLVRTVRRPFGFGILIEQINPRSGNVIGEKFLQIPGDTEGET
jgi:hypothetical protein